MRLKKLLFVSILFCSGMTAFGQQRFRLGDPQALQGTQGWRVAPRLRELSLGIPAASVPGEIPVDLALRVNGSFRCNVTQRQIYDYDLLQWVVDSTTAHDSPAYGTLHFGYLAAPASYNGAISSGTYVLEDGTQFSTLDFVAFSTFNAAFSLAQDFGFPAMPLSALNVSVTGTHVTYITTLDAAGLGATWASRISQPQGYGASITQVQVIMDAGRARVYGYLAGLNTWVPLLWVDKGGHWVTFQWRQNVTGLPSTLTAVRSVQAVNQRGKGVLLQWAEFVDWSQIQDLARVDYVGIDAPSVRVQGYPGWSTVRPVGYTYSWGSVTPDFYDFVHPACGGPMGRPTSVGFGASNDANLPSPSWLPYGQPVPTRAGSASAPFQAWQIGWDANHASITTLDEPSGLHTAFSTYGNTVISGGSTTATKNTKIIYFPYDTWGIQESATTDTAGGGGTLHRRWTFDYAAPETTVVFRETFANLDTCPRETRLTFAKTTARDAGNAALLKREIRDSASGSALETVQYNATGIGVDGTLTGNSQTVFTRVGEPTRTTIYSIDSDMYGLFSRVETMNAGASPVTVQKITRDFIQVKNKLELARPSNTSTTRYDPSTMIALAQQPVESLQYDPQGRVIRHFVSLMGVLASGQVIGYDAEWRPNSTSAWDNSFQSIPIRTQTTTFDPGTGSPATVTTT